MTPQTFLRSVLGLTWIALAALKLQSVGTLEAYLTHALPIGSGPAALLAPAIVAVEFALGFWLLASLLSARPLGGGSRDLLISGLVAAASAVFVLVMPEEGPSCGCFGAALEATRGARLAVAGAIGFLSFVGANQYVGQARETAG